jgi:ABC-type nitrate/sulfonate/bicarbonate transport system ATPase subunit
VSGGKAIELVGIRKAFGETQVLNDLNIHVNGGELVSVLGPSGCGKSTLMNIATGLVESDAGSVRVGGRIGYMQQKDLLLPWRTIMQNAILPKTIAGTPKDRARAEAAPYFAVFGLEGYEDKYPYELSGGMRQRANFLRTFLTSGDIMLLDEPFGALDSITRRKLQDWLLDVMAEVGLTILFITHDIEEAIMLSDRVYVLSDKPSRVRAEYSLEYCRDEKGRRTVDPMFIEYKKEILGKL